jgi:hypothetical protein
MLHQLSEEIAECYLRAEQARLQAKQTHDAALKQESLDMERRWIGLARSYEFTERLFDLHQAKTPAELRPQAIE